MYRAHVVHSGGSGQGFIAEIDEADGWFFASGGTYHRTTFLRSSDGRSFEATSTPKTSGLRGLVARAEDDVIVVGEYGTIAITRDRGDTWEIADSAVNHCLYRVLDANGALWAVCDSGVVRSDDEGQTWDRVHRSARMLKCDDVGGRLFFYGDGMYVLDGERFVEVQVDREAPLTGLAQTPEGSLVLIGDGGQVFTSDDTGTNWTRVRTPTGADLEDMAVIEGGLVVVGAGGVVMFSENGRDWELIDVKVKDHFWSVLAIDDGLLVGCQGGKIYRFEGAGASTSSSDWEDLD